VKPTAAQRRLLEIVAEYGKAPWCFVAWDNRMRGIGELQLSACVRRGWINRIRHDPEHGPVDIVEITPAGRAALEREVSL
jgi:hypothetical protein